MSIINFGSLNIDHVYSVDHFVQPGETATATEYNLHLGGKGHNQSIALAKAGAEVWHAGCIGKDGGALCQSLCENGVRTDYIRTSSRPSGHALIQVDRHGQNSILVYPGANGDIQDNYIEDVLQHFGKGDALLLQNETAKVDVLIEKAAKYSVRVIFNPSPFTQNIEQYPLDLVDLFLLNELEGALISGESAEDKMLDALKNRFPKAEFLLTLGENGAWYCYGDKRLYQPAYKTTVVDTTAAGDTFTGYFLAQYKKNGDAKRALSLAAMASSIAVSRHGAAISIPFLAEVEQRLSKKK